jgi:aryl-alcohol dehydrogenase-like predicted oxidoreductase
LPPGLKEELGNLPKDAQTSIQFVRSAPGVTTALIGMSSASHVEENMKLAKIEPTGAEDYKKLFVRS